MILPSLLKPPRQRFGQALVSQLCGSREAMTMNQRHTEQTTQPVSRKEGSTHTVYWFTGYAPRDGVKAAYVVQTRYVT